MNVSMSAYVNIPMVKVGKARNGNKCLHDTIHIIRNSKTEAEGEGGGRERRRKMKRRKVKWLAWD